MMAQRRALAPEGTAASELIGGPNPIVGFRRADIFDSVRSVAAQALRNGRHTTHSLLRLAGATLDITRSRVVHRPGAKDHRFADRAWSEHFVYRVLLLQLYLAAYAELDSVFDTTEDPTLLGIFATEQTLAAAKRHSHASGVLDGRELGRIFSLLRPGRAGGRRRHPDRPGQDLPEPEPSRVGPRARRCSMVGPRARRCRLVGPGAQLAWSQARQVARWRDQGRRQLVAVQGTTDRRRRRSDRTADQRADHGLLATQRNPPHRPRRRSPCLVNA
jgi:hypothetical protein